VSVKVANKSGGVKQAFANSLFINSLFLNFNLADKLGYREQ
jgi:hypothetical protein